MGASRRHVPNSVVADSLNALAKRAFTFAALIAISLQSFVVQSHVDGLDGLGARATIERAAGHGVDQAAARAISGSGDSQTACPICEALATAGAAVFASGPALVSALGVIAHEAIVDIRTVPVRPAHAWQSRAPPIAL